MKLSILYCPVFFHFELIRQAVDRLEIEDAPSRSAQATRYTASRLQRWMHIFHILKTLSFAMRVFAQGQSKEALRQMITIVDQPPVEVLGV